MTDELVLEQVKKAIDLFLDKTYEMKDLYEHMLQIIREKTDGEKIHKERLEKILYDIDELQALQAKYWAGHKQILPECKKAERNLALKKNNLLNMGYSIGRFKNKVQQQRLL